MSQWQQQVQANAAAIQGMLNNAKKYSEHAALQSLLNNNDILLFELTDGTVVRVSYSDLKNQITGESGGFSVQPIENHYTNIADMLADQENQSLGYIQYVTDANADENVLSGSAYYEKLTTSNASLEDYVLLTGLNSAVLSFTNYYRTLKCKEKVETQVETVEDGYFSVLRDEEGGVVKGIVFPQGFSKYLFEIKNQLPNRNYVLYLYGKSQSGTLIADVGDIVFADADDSYVKVFTNGTINEVEINIDSTWEIYLLDKGASVTQTSQLTNDGESGSPFVSQDDIDFMDNVANLIIGGVGSTINTPSLLADKLKKTNGQSYSYINITDFRVINSDVYAVLDLSYQVREEVFKNNTDIDRYIDKKMCKDVGANSFKGSQLKTIELYECDRIGGSSGYLSFSSCNDLTTVILPKCTFIQTQSFLSCSSLKEIYLPKVNTLKTRSFESCSSLKVIDIPLCKDLGLSTSNTDIFEGIPSNATINVHYSLATTNNGQPDADLVYAISQGATVNYIVPTDETIEFTEDFIKLEPTADIVLKPNYSLPASTQDIVIEAKNINVNTVASFSAGIINSQEVFLNNFGALAIRVNYRADNVEESVTVTLNNGIETIFTNVYNIVNGTIHTITSDDWTKTEPINVNENSVEVKTYDVFGYADSKNSYIFDYTKDYSIKWKVKNTPLGGVAQNYTLTQGVNLLNASDDGHRISASYYSQGSNLFLVRWYDGGNYSLIETLNNNGNTYLQTNNDSYELKYLSGEVTLFKNGVLVYSYPTNTISEDFYVRIGLKVMDIYDIQFTDLSSAGTPPQYNDNYATKEYVDEAIKDILNKDENVDVAYDVDWKIPTHYLTLVGDTVLTDINLPSVNETKPITIYISGDFALTLPVGWDVNLTGEYDGSVLNQIVVEYIESGLYWVTINQVG